MNTPKPSPSYVSVLIRNLPTSRIPTVGGVLPWILHIMRLWAETQGPQPSSGVVLFEVDYEGHSLSFSGSPDWDCSANLLPTIAISQAKKLKQPPQEMDMKLGMQLGMHHAHWELVAEMGGLLNLFHGSSGAYRLAQISCLNRFVELPKEVVLCWERNDAILRPMIDSLLMQVYLHRDVSWTKLTTRLESFYLRKEARAADQGLGGSVLRRRHLMSLLLTGSSPESPPSEFSFDHPEPQPPKPSAPMEEEP